MRLATMLTLPIAVGLLVLTSHSAASTARWQAPFAVAPASEPAGRAAVNDAGYAAFVSGLREQHEPTPRLTLRVADPSNAASNAVSTSKLALPPGLKTEGGTPFVSATGRVIVLAGAGHSSSRSIGIPRPQLAIASGTLSGLPSAAQLLSVDCAHTPKCMLAVGSDPRLVWRPDGSAVVAWTEAGHRSWEMNRVRAAVIAPDGRLAESVTLTDEPLRQGVELGLTSNGTVIATWITRTRGTRHSLVTRRLDPGGSWSAAESEPIRLPRVPGASMENLTDDAGDQYAIWTHGWRRPRIRAAYRPAGGRLSRPVTLAQVDTRDDDVDLDFDADVGPDGTAIVAWNLHGSTREGDDQSLRESTRPIRPGTRGSLRVRIARRGARWSGTQRLGGSRRFPGFPSAVVAADGTATLTWSEYGRWPGRATLATQTLTATATPAGVFSAPAAIPGTLTARGVCANGDLAVAPADTAVLLLDCPGPSLARATPTP